MGKTTPETSITDRDNDCHSEVEKSGLILSEIQNIITTLFEKEPEETKAIFDKLLGSIGSSIGISRAYIFEAYLKDDQYLVNQTNEWVAAGVKPQIDNPITHHVNMLEIGLEKWQQGFLKNQVVNDVISELNGQDKQIFEEQDIKTVVAAPIYFKGEWRGFIGFDDCVNDKSWDKNEINALKLCSKTIGSALGYIDITKSKRAAEKQAKDVEQKIHDALESAEHGVWDWDLRTDKVYYSEILQKQLGYNGHEFTDALTEWSDRVHPDDAEATYQKVKDHLAGKTPVYRAEFRMRKKDGSYAWMLAIAKAIRDENGNPIRLPGTHTDLTFQKELESELNKQQELLHSLVRGFPDLVWLKDRDGVYLAANTRFEDFFGHPSSEIMGNTDYDFVDKDLADFFRDHDKKAIARGSPSINEETITFASDGHQETLETIKTPIHFKNGDLIGVLSVGRDITERKKAQEQLILAASVFENAHDGILICNAEVEIIDVNPVFESISGYSKDEVIGKNPRLLSSGNQSKNFYKKLWNDLKNKGFWQGEILNRRKTGEFYPILSNISCIKNNHGQITHYLSIFTDITQLKNHQKKLENLAHFDALTGLPNRVLLAERLDREIIRTKRELNMLAVCFIDLDNFKPVNDQLGHATGDDLLKLLSKRLSEFIREGDTLARIGGDEFILLLSSQTNRSLVKILAEKILKEIEKPLTLNGQIFHISASMGITLYPEDNSDPDALIRHADQAMYEAKLLGKSRIHLFDVAANEAYIEHNAFISEATQAIKENRFILYFQPKVNIKSKIIIGFEALIRWQHPQKGLLFPSDFLPTIEQHKLSYDLDLWVLDQALSQLEDWRRRNFDIVLSINITPNSLLSEVFIDELERKLKQHQKLKPQNLEIEIVETSNFSEIETAQIHLRRLKSLGIRVAIDDFGTGASSLSYLKNLPANVVKIDQSFVFDILEDRNDLAIVEGIIQLARVFDLDVVAEGVETKEHAEILYALGCHIIQGYWIAKPIQPDLVNDFILNWQIPNDFKYL